MANADIWRNKVDQLFGADYKRKKQGSNVILSGDDDDTDDDENGERVWK